MKKTILRSYDIFLSLLILILFSIPIILFIIIKLFADGTPLFFNSKRIGKKNKLFTVYKFRTMVDDHAFIQNYISTIHKGGFEKIPLDAVIYTKMGRFFERFQIVEFLQLFNVLKGNMSIIGYRPLPLAHVVQLEEELGNKMIDIRHSQLPGITGISQIVGKIVLTNSERVKVENSYNKFVQASNTGKIILINTLIIFETFVQIILRKHLFVSFLKKQLHIIRFPGFDHFENESIDYYFPKPSRNILKKVIKNLRKSA